MDDSLSECFDKEKIYVFFFNCILFIIGIIDIVVESGGVYIIN